jgi:hypothetical protein
VVADLAGSDIVDPCDPDKTPEDFLGEIIDSMAEAYISMMIESLKARYGNRSNLSKTNIARGY